MSNLYLIGYRGAGKSTVSDIVAAKLSRQAVHMDKELEKRIGHIDEFVKKKGWEAFREAETGLLSEISKKKRLIVDCGGGIVTKSKNIEIIRSTGRAVWLKASVASIISRIKQDKKNKRPSLTGKAVTKEVAGVLSVRIPLYKKTADIEIDTERKDVRQVANEVIFHSEDIPRIAVVVAENTLVKAISKIKEAEKKFELLEVRIDFIKNLNLQGIKKIINSKTKKLIITNRKKSEGGKFTGKEDERISLLNKAIELDADYVDIEFFSDWSKISRENKKHTRIICSYHNFIDTPFDLEELYEKMKKKNPDIIKIACTGTSYDDYLRMLGLISVAKKQGINLTGIIMGDYGKPLRIQQVLFGNEIAAYAPLGNNFITPGQMSMAEMKEMLVKLR